MHPVLSAPHSQRPALKRAPLPFVRFRRWSIPLLATLAIGYGVTQSKAMQTDSPYQIHSPEAEEERLKKNQQLMDAYGYKDNVDDLQKALEAYEVR